MKLIERSKNLYSNVNIEVVRLILNSAWFHYTLLIIIIESISLMAFFPAIMSGDSVVQWNQILNHSFSDYHPAFHTILMWMITRIWRSPASIAFVQILFFSIISGWGFSILQKDLSIPSKIVWVLCCLYSISLVNVLYVITIWKDIPYSISILAVTLMMLKITLSRGKWLEKYWLWIGVFVVFITFFRHNGIVTSLGVFLILSFAYKKYIKFISAAFLVFTISGLIIRGPLFSALHVTGLSSRDHYRTIFALSNVVHLVAAHVVDGTELTVFENLFIRKLHPQNDWGKFYLCFVVTSMYEPNNINWEPIFDSPSTLLKIAYSLTLRNPKTTLKNFLCRTDFIWNIPQGKDISYTLLSPIWPGANPQYSYIYTDSRLISPAQNPVIPRIGFAISEFFASTAVGTAKILIWRSALYLYSGLLSFGIFLLKYRKTEFLIVPIPILLHTLGVFIAAPSPDFRYQYPVFLVFWYLLGFLFIVNNKENQKFVEMTD